MLQDFQYLSLPDIDLGHTLAVLFVAFTCGSIISILYQWSYKGSSYSPTFVRSMIFMSMITAVVMLAIGNNLARAFGLVGAMSIIRFRTAVKDPQDIVFVFFALATGLAAGVGMFMVALVGTVTISAVILLASKTDFGVINRRSFLLQMSYNSHQENGEASYLPILQKYCKRHNLVNARTNGSEDELDLTFYLRLRRQDDLQELTRALGQDADVRNVNIFFDERQQ